MTLTFKTSYSNHSKRKKPYRTPQAFSLAKKATLTCFYKTAFPFHKQIHLHVAVKPPTSITKLLRGDAVCREWKNIYIPIHLRRSGSRTQPRRESDYVYNILPRAMLIRAARSPLVIDYYAVGCRAARQLIYEPRGWREGRERRWSRNLTWNSDGLVTPANTHDRDFFSFEMRCLSGRMFVRFNFEPGMCVETN